MDQTTRGTFAIGQWLVEPDLNRLSSGEEIVHLQPRTMDVLVYLADRAGQVVSADDMIRDVWHDRPMGDNPVYKAIAQLRRALGDETGEPRFIVTVPKKGYRLIATPEAPAERSKTRTAGARRLTRNSLPVVIGLVAGLALAALYRWQAPDSQPRLEAVSHFSGSHSQPSFAPDGRSFAFVSDTGSMPQIWILDADQEAPRQLTFAERPARRPRWSPAGDTLLFASAGNVYSIAADGGTHQEVLRDAYNPNWSHDGARIVFERRYEVWTASADGSAQARVAGVPRRELTLAERWPAFSPDGNAIVFFESGETPMGDLWTVNLTTSATRQLTFEPAFGGAPVWSPGGAEIVYSSLRGGSRTLWSVDPRSLESRAMLTGSGDDDFPDFSPDGERIIYSNSRERFTLLRSDPRSDSHTTLHESRQPLIGPELSPDHETIVLFGLARPGGVQLMTIPLEGGSPTALTSDALAAHAIPRWSPDGRSIYFFHTRDGDRYSRVDAGGENQQTVVDGWTWNTANGAALDPSGTRIIYSRLAGQSPIQTSIRDLRSGADAAFHATLEYPRWARDGSTVAGSLFDDGSFPGDIAICTVDIPECRTVAERARIPRFSSDEQQLYFVRGFGRSQELFVASLAEAGDERHLMTMEPLFPLGPFYSVVDDGSILWVRHDEEPGEIWIVESP